MVRRLLDRAKEYDITPLRVNKEHAFLSICLNRLGKDGI
jgi:hypothetical protein